MPEVFGITIERVKGESLLPSQGLPCMLYGRDDPTVPSPPWDCRMVLGCYIKILPHESIVLKCEKLYLNLFSAAMVRFRLEFTYVIISICLYDFFSALANRINNRLNKLLLLAGSLEISHLNHCDED